MLLPDSAEWTPPSIGPREVHVWWTPLDVSEATLARLADWLSPDERARCARLRFHRDRQRFTAARGQLRVLLGAYLDQPPGTIRFRYGTHGKPALAEPDGRGLRFNVAHAAALAVYAVVREGQVGVDVEQVQPLDDAESIAARCFSAREIAALRALPPEERLAGFFCAWTAKEAYLKAIGEGLTLDLDSFDVALGPDAPARLLGVRADPAEASRWSLWRLAPAAGYVATVAAEGRRVRLIA